jgi:hypothetical protein
MSRGACGGPLRQLCIPYRNTYVLCCVYPVPVGHSDNVLAHESYNPMHHSPSSVFDLIRMIIECLWTTSVDYMQTNDATTKIEGVSRAIVVASGLMANI